MFARTSASLLLPISVNVSITQLLVPALAAILARSTSPAEAIGGYAIALSVIQLLKLPELRVQQLTLVFLEHRGSLPALRRFIAVLAGVVALATVLIALTPLRDPVIEQAFGTRGALGEEAKRALIWLTPLPPLGVIRTYQYGRLLRVGAVRLVWAGTTTGVVVVLATALALVLSGAVDGAAAAATAVSVGAAVEVALLWRLDARAIRSLEAAAGRPAASQREMLQFFVPLLFVAMLPAVTYPLVNATVARAPEPDVSLAAVAAAYGVFQVVILPTNGVQSTALALFARRAPAMWVVWFGLAVGVASLVVAAAIVGLPGLDAFVFARMMGVEGRLYELTVVAFLVLAVLPPFLALEQLYAAALMRLRRTNALLWINGWRLLGLVVWIVAVPVLTPWSGVVIGAGAITATLILEAVLTYAYGVRSMRELVAAPA